jgi:hypothetical protein
MEVNVFRRMVAAKETASYLLSSDIHADDNEFNRKIFTKEYTKAADKGARIYIAGDVLRCILINDKRYTKSSDIYDSDDIIGESIEQAVALFKPYVDYIDIIGCGNHETAILKRNNVDVIRLLINRLNTLRSEKLDPIVHGGYEGWIRIYFDRPGGNTTFIFTIWYNHGQGGSSPVTKGIIDLARRGYIDADVIWMGHKHQRISVEMDPLCCLTTNSNKIHWKERRGIITGCYGNRHREYDIKEKGYQLSFSEEKCRTPQAIGGAFINVNHYSHEWSWNVEQ